MGYKLKGMVLTKTVYEMLPYAGIVYTMSFENRY